MVYSPAYTNFGYGKSTSNFIALNDIILYKTFRANKNAIRMLITF